MIAHQELLSIFRQTGALLEGHFRLSSGLHSAQYFQCAKVLQHPQFTTRLCRDLADAFAASRIDVVVAPALGGIVVGQETGRVLNVRTMFTERKDGVMQLRRGFDIVPGERILVCEDVVTTGGSVREVIGIVKRKGGIVAGVGFVVDRSGGSVRFEVDPDGKQHALLKLDVVAYDPASCPLCRQDVPIDQPGSRGNTVTV